MSEISGESDEKEEMSTDDKISAYESLLMDCKEAIEVNIHGYMAPMLTIRFRFIAEANSCSYLF